MIDKGNDVLMPLMPKSPPVEEVDLREYGPALRRRWPIVLTVALAVFAFMARKTLREPNMYEASTKLVVVTKGGGGESSSIAGELEGLRQAKDVDTQVEIINSPDLIEKAFDLLPAAERQEGFGSENAPGWAYMVGGRHDTDIITISAKAYSPKAAADFANVIAETYLQDDLSRNGSATRKAREYVQRERVGTGADLRSASAALSDYKRQTGLIAAREQASSLAKAQIDFRNQLDDARGDAEASRRRLQILQSQVKGMPPSIVSGSTITESPKFILLRGQLVQLESQLAEQSQEFTPDSIEITGLKDRIGALQSRLQAVARTYVSSRSVSPNPARAQIATDLASAQVALAVSEARVAALDSQFTRTTKELGIYPEREKKLAELQQRVDELNRTYNMLSDRYYSLLIDERSNLANGMIAARARPPGGPSSPQVMKSLMVAFLVSLFLGVASGLVFERFDTKAHSPLDAELLYGMASLTLVPEAKPAQGIGENLKIGQVAPNHAFTEAFRLLRNNIGFLSPDHPIRSMAVTSAAVGEGKSTTSVNLAIAMAMDGKRVLLIDADLRRPALHRWMSLSNDVGFSTVVRGLTALTEAVQATEYEGLSCLTSGPLPPNPTEFLNSDRSLELVRQAKVLYDVVVVDAPPCTGLSDTQVISTIVDGMLIVAALDRTTKPLMSAATRMLRQANANLLGLVINRVKNRRLAYDYYGYDCHSAHDAEPSESERVIEKV